jgi:aldehyde dehydrogenase (NAD+)
MMTSQYKMLKVGAAMDDLDIGPLISKKQYDIVSGYIEQGKDLELAATGIFNEAINKGGFYCLPHLFVDVPANHSLAQNEIFGPVQIIMPFENEDHAIEIANGTGFGLVASVWTKDGSRQMRMAQRLKSGQVFINNYGAGGGVELPFGGRGLSGHGREKGFEAMFGFTTLKTVAHYHG